MKAMQLFERITWNPTAVHPWNEADRAPSRGGRRDLPKPGRPFPELSELEPEDVRQALAFAAASVEDSATESSVA